MLMQSGLQCYHYLKTSGQDSIRRLDFKLVSLRESDLIFIQTASWFPRKLYLTNNPDAGKRLVIAIAKAYGDVIARSSGSHRLSSSSTRTLTMVS